MIFIDRTTIKQIAWPELTEDSFVCVAIPRGTNAETKQAILILNGDTLTVLSISTLSDHLIHRGEYPRNNVEQCNLIDAILTKRLQFTHQNKKYTFHILKLIIPLGNMQALFLEALEKEWTL